jgi:hypothetical protein
MSGSNEAPPSGPTRGAVATVVVTIALLAALVWALTPPSVPFTPAPLEPVPADCPKIAREFVPSNLTEVPDALLARLAPEKRMRALYRLNMEPCPCGCNSSVASCRVNYPKCETSRKLAEKIIAEVQAEIGRK